MFDDPHKRTFFSAPQSVQSLIAAFLEPGITVLTFIVTTLSAGELMDRPALTLCLLVFALTFPGRDRFREPLLEAAVDIASSWVVLLSILALCAYATRSFHYFENNVLLAWAVVTPILQWLATWLGRTIVRQRAARPESRRTAIVVGASSLGVKVARALQGGDHGGVEFVGFFDDRTDGRIDADAKSQVLGKLSDVAAYTGEHRVREVYITLPLGSQPRIVELLDQLQGTTASLFFVPDVFGISIIQGRLQDMNGVPVVGICETPFTGTNELVKRMSDVVIASSKGEMSTMMTQAMMMSLIRFTSWLVPVNGVSQMPTTGTPFMSCSRPWMMLMPNTSGTKKSDAVVSCSCSSSSTMRGCEPSGKVM